MTLQKFRNSEDVQDTVESLQQYHGNGRPTIYLICIAVVFAGLGCLPLVHVAASIGAPGQLRPAAERFPVFPAIGGLVKELSVSDNLPVKLGDVLLRIDSSAVEARLDHVESQQTENERALADVNVLIAAVIETINSTAPEIGFGRFAEKTFAYDLPSRLVTPQLVRTHAVFVSEVKRLLLQRDKARQDLDRLKKLHSRGIVPDAELAQQEFAFSSIEKELDLATQQSLGRWQSEKLDRELNRLKLDSEWKQLSQQIELHTIRANSDGVALGFEGLNIGQYLKEGERIGEISPSSHLQADVYIQPRDVGFVRPGMFVNIQVDAFQYTEWGVLKGVVRSVSQDFVQVGPSVAFKAVIDLQGTRLGSSSGAVVEIKRGMTVNARFLLNERSLFSLLYGKLSDSLDPRAGLTLQHP